MNSLLLRMTLIAVAALAAGSVPAAPVHAAEAGPSSSSPAAAAREADAPPNFIVILIDDMGWTDLGCYGSEFYQTPHIDRLAREGMRFTNGYAACTVCSPTRASLITGRYPARVGITDWIPGQDPKDRKLRGAEDLHQLPLEEITLAEMLKPRGYASASIGKWHLGGAPYYPDRNGFDVNIAGTASGAPPSYFSPYVRNAKQEGSGIGTLSPGPPGEYLTDRLTDEAIRFVEEHHDRPFLLYLPHFAVHTPIQAKGELRELYASRVSAESPQKSPTYAAMIHSVDEGVGRILEMLKRLKIDERTLILFTSDNGGLVVRNADNVPITHNIDLRAGKGSAYEGGVRVPWIARWPGVIPAGATSDVPVITADIFPTLAELAGVTIEHVVDGESLVPLLKQSGSLPDRDLFWHYPHYHAGGATPYSAIRRGDFKLIEFFEDGRLELYNLKTDQMEQHNLAGERPDLARELHAALASWRKEVNAKLPLPNGQ